MSNFKHLKNNKRLALTLCLLLLVTGSVISGLLHTLNQDTADNSLTAYRATHFITIEGVKDLSGIALSPEGNTLFAVESTHSHLFEMDMQGHILRHIDLFNFNDVEDIAHLGDNHYLIVQERNRTVTWVNIDKNTHSLNADNYAHASMQTHLGNNKGLEGIAWSEIHGVWVANEKYPADIYHLKIPEALSGTNLTPTESNLHSAIFEASGFEIRGVKDISALYADDAQKRLLVLSDDSHKLIATNYEDGLVTETLELDQGRIPFMRFLDHPEGITMDKERRIYIAGEPNKLMILEPKAR